jgi:NHL repeat-containing protein
MCISLKSRLAIATVAVSAGIALCLSSVGNSLFAAETPQTVPAVEEPADVHRVTLSTCYQVDPTWPKRPDNCQWGRMPGVAVDDKDQVWIFTRAYPPVQVYDAQGNFVRAWGSDLVGRTERGVTSHQIKIDDRGMIWLADIGRHTVIQVTPQGKVLRTLGTPGVPGNDESHFNKPTDMAITPQGDVYVTDGYVNSRVVHFDKDDNFVKQWGKPGTGPGEFNLVHAIVRDSQGRFYVADRNNARVQVFDPNGKFLDQWTDIIIPWGFWISKRDEIWVCGCSPMPWTKHAPNLSCPPKDQMFMRFDTSGKLKQLWTVPKCADGEEKPGELNWLHGIALDSKGNIYATDIMGQRVQKFVRQD